MSLVSRMSSRRRTLTAVSVGSALALALTACGADSSPGSATPGADKPSASAPTAGAGHHDSSMPGMKMSTGDGLVAEKDGYRMASDATTLPSGKRTDYRFTITGPGGKPVTGFALEQTKRLHFYAIRSDLTGFQHLHPTMAGDGTWTSALDALRPGSWRVFAQFTPETGAGKGRDFVLSRSVTVPGPAATTAVPKAAATTTVDGYTVTVKGELMAGMAHPLTVTVGKDGKPVTGLQPYLDTYAHLTAFHEGDQAFAHLHPENKVDGGHGGPRLPFHAELAKPGNWRLFLQFRTAGRLHTAALTLHVS
ncbi:hypothetical protein [Streptomyces chattanoogensis]|uniref:Secreted protein n=1 Tax=Streptomyces chattanoogensis TaxID=66876 RepID=A0A0N0XYE0_9ACTN|nr:hypothetical protein [Streptomyces chattanoogensis]KPC63998.1 hypothetical protein ADL29_13145 [Streptomyces chattanoogensis]